MGDLSDFLRDTFEWRRGTDGETTYDYVRPASMKTCPPNYLLHGFQMAVTPDEHNGIGITSLDCVRPTGNTNAPTEHIQRPLDADNTGDYDYTLSARPFSLSQEIGDPGAADPITVECDNPDDVIVGITTEYAASGDPNAGVLERIWLHCISRP